MRINVGLTLFERRPLIAILGLLRWIGDVAFTNLQPLP